MTATKQTKSLDQRIEETIDGNIGLVAVLMVARQELGDANLAKFLDVTPEKGSELWVKFKAWKAGQADFVGFTHFIAATIVPDAARLFGKK